MPIAQEHCLSEGESYIWGRSGVGYIPARTMTAEANEVRGHFRCTFVSISRILHDPSSSLITYCNYTYTPGCQEKLGGKVSSYYRYKSLGSVASWCVGVASANTHLWGG